jgi:hypothetical protein
VTSKKITWVALFVEIVRTRADHLPCQPTITAQLFLDGGKIEPYTIIIMDYSINEVDQLIANPTCKEAHDKVESLLPWEHADP